MKTAITLFFTIFIVLNSFSQFVFKGRVETSKDGKYEPLPFATVALKDFKDSVNVVTGTITDAKGDFIVDNVPAGKYRVYISMVGYNTISDILETAGKKTITRNYRTEQALIGLDEVSVKGSSVTRGEDKQIYAISAQDAKLAVSGVDLTMKIPKLFYDENAQKLVSPDGGTVKVLINGVNATEQELLTLSPSEVKRIEYYDFPPAKYAGAAKVVNVITTQLTEGLIAGINLQHAFTTGFFNDGLYLKYNKGNNQWSFRGFTNYRNYDNVVHKENYRYRIGEDDFLREENEAREFGYDNHNLKFSFTRNLADQYLLQVSVIPYIFGYHVDGDIDIMQKKNEIIVNRQGVMQEKRKLFSPSLDVYYSVCLPNNQELQLNLLGTLHSATQDYSRKEEEKGEKVLNEIMNLDNDKESLIAQFNYVKTYGNMSLSLGNTLNYGRLNSTVESNNKKERGELVKEEYVTNLFTNYTYGELSGVSDKWKYRFSLGAYLFDNSNDITNYRSWFLRANAILSYKINDNIGIQARYKRETRDPSLGELSNNRQFVSEKIYKEGNPNLENSVSDNFSFIFNLDNSWLNAELDLWYNDEQDAIFSYFVQSKDIISLKYENAESQKEWGAGYSFRFNPFANRLMTFKLFGSVVKYDIKSAFVGKSSYTSYPVDWQTTLNYKDFSLSYRGNIRGKELSGPYIRREEKISDLKLRYTKGNISVTAMVFWFLSDAEYETTTLSSSIVDYYFLNDIRDNKNMFTLGLTYRFSTGNKFKERQKKLHNQDSDAGLF